MLKKDVKWSEAKTLTCVTKKVNGFDDEDLYANAKCIALEIIFM